MLLTPEVDYTSIKIIFRIDLYGYPLKAGFYCWLYTAAVENDYYTFHQSIASVNKLIDYVTGIDVNLTFLLSKALNFTLDLVMTNYNGIFNLLRKKKLIT